MQHMLPLLNNMEAPPGQSSKQQQLMRTVSISVLVMSLPVLYVSFLHVPPASLFRDTTFWFLMSNSIIIVIAADSGMLFFRSSSSSSASPDDDDGGLSFAAVSVSEPAVTTVVVKDGRHAPSMGGSDETEAIKDQQALVVQEHGDLAAAIAESDHRAYALVERGDRVVVTTPETRDIVVVTPSATNVDASSIVPAAATRRLTASRGLAEREERRATRRRHQHGHGHRPSHSHSQVLVPVQDKSVVVSEDSRHLRRERPPPAEEEMIDEKESEYSRLSDEELNRRVEEFIARFNREIRLQLEKEEQAAAA
ncbi:unnamed protein product [Miscanthus lutarioriparius]|uniref:Uncharacterized protein n=1 Tax=Miscanthus lutarioriparius TaxID=422564 RepID=A0A811RA06_9POAL|nr:unnamed protein product [Miscanthus lutarioriparius]